MELSAPVSKYLSCAYRVLFLIITLLLCVVFTPLTKAQAQTTMLPSYEQPNVDATVPQNQHTFVQSMTIEVLASFICQIADVDVFNPTQGCLQVNPTTHTLTYATPSSSTGDIHIGGLVGVGTQLLSSIYIPPASGVAYMKDVASNFGVVKHTYAQTKTQTGFDALFPVQKLWLSVRNLTYIFFVLILVFIGVGVMLRIHIDPHTIMSIQNQLPKIVIALILISFSYAIVGLLIDFMWVTTYFSINVLTSADNPSVTVCGETVRDKIPAAINSQLPPNLPKEATTLKTRSYSNILEYPVAFMNDVFQVNHCDTDEVANILAGKAGVTITQSGLANLSYQVGTSMGDFVKQAIKDVLIPDNENAGCSIVPTSFNLRACLAGVVGFFVGILGILIALIAILIAMIRLWWSLLRAYIYIIIYTITAPFWILLGLLPNSSLGFGRWIRTVIANLLIFPVSAAMIVGARIVMELYTSQTPNVGPGATGPDSVQPFLAPFVGNPALTSFGALIAFGILMIVPNMLDIVRNALQTPPGNIGQMVQSGFGVGQTAVAAGIGASWGRLTGVGNPHFGIASGILRRAALGVGTPTNRFQRAMRSLTGARAFNGHEIQGVNNAPLPGAGGHNP